MIIIIDDNTYRRTDILSNKTAELDQGYYYECFDAVLCINTTGEVYIKLVTPLGLSPKPVERTV